MRNAKLQAVNADYVHGLITTAEWVKLVMEIGSLEPTAETESNREVVWTCDNCGCIGEWDDGCVELEKHEVDGKLFCSDECVVMAGYHRCESCGDWCAGDEVIEHDGDWYCDRDCAHDADLEECDHCGEWFDRYDGEVFEYQYGWRRIWCEASFCSETCAIDHGFIRCDRCDEWTRQDDALDVEVSHRTEQWCDSCSDETFVCESCDERRPDDDYESDGYCRFCCEDAHLHEYGYHPYLNFFGGSEFQRDTPFFGIELETDSGNNRLNYVAELHAIEADGNDFASRFWMTEDSSLTNGVEITGHPMTLAHHVEIKGIYESIRDTARRFGYVSHDSGNCGLHIHVNRNFFGRTKEAQDAGGYKMMRALQRFEHQFTEFSRRTDNNWCRYSYYENYAMAKKNGKVMYTMREFLSKAGQAASDRDHCQCLNFQHRATFEFRIFRGTLKIETLYASMALVNGLCHTAKQRGSMFFEHCTWYELVDEIVANVDEPYAKECLVAYLKERGLN